MSKRTNDDDLYQRGMELKAEADQMIEASGYAPYTPEERAAGLVTMTYAEFDRAWPRPLNSVTVFMGMLGLVIALVGIALIVYAVEVSQIVGVLCGLLWLAFGGTGAVFAWNTRRKP